MKKISFVLSAILALALVSLVSAADWTAPTTYPIKVIESAGHVADSLTGIDSITLFSYATVDPTATYALALADSIASGDSIVIRQQTYNSSGVLVGVTFVDTVRSTDTYITIALPTNKTLQGTSMTIKGLGLVAALKKRIRSCVLVKVMPVTGYLPNATR